MMGWDAIVYNLSKEDPTKEKIKNKKEKEKKENDNTKVGNG